MNGSRIGNRTECWSYRCRWLRRPFNLQRSFDSILRGRKWFFRTGWRLYSRDTMHKLRLFSETGRAMVKFSISVDSEDKSRITSVSEKKILVTVFRDSKTYSVSSAVFESKLTSLKNFKTISTFINHSGCKFLKMSFGKKIIFSVCWTPVQIK